MACIAQPSAGQPDQTTCHFVAPCSPCTWLPSTEIGMPTGMASVISMGRRAYNGPVPRHRHTRPGISTSSVYRATILSPSPHGSWAPSR